MLYHDIVAGVSANRRANLLIQYKSLDNSDETSYTAEILDCVQVYVLILLVKSHVLAFSV